jgi:Peptidase_C39 like family
MAKERESQDAVEVDFSKSIAKLTSRQFSLLPLRGIERLANATLAEEPLILFDLNGQTLFHDYALAGETGIAGTIRTAANRRLGAPLISISLGDPGWNPSRAKRLAVESLHSTEPTAIVEDSQLVVYAHPKIGIRLDYRVRGKREIRSQVFDAASGGAVEKSRETHNQFTQYSLLDSLRGAELKARRKRFAEAERQVRNLRGSLPRLFAHHRRHPLGRLFKGEVFLSPYCPHSPIGLTHYSQITNYFCVDASAQMLMEHYGWNYTQNQIAIAMGTSVANGGTTQAGLTTGFASLTHNSLPLTFDNGATRAQQWQDAVTEVSANRPLFTQVPHHYRVCVGFFESLLALPWVTLGLDQMLYIYDPWPWNPDLCQGGAIYWESWATSPVMWFGIVHHA